MDIPDFAVEGGSGEERHCHMEGGVLRWGRSGKGGAGGGSDKAISIPDSDKDKIGTGSGHDGDSRVNATTIHRLR